MVCCYADMRGQSKVLQEVSRNSQAEETNELFRSSDKPTSVTCQCVTTRCGQNLNLCKGVEWALEVLVFGIPPHDEYSCEATEGKTL